MLNTQSAIELIEAIVTNKTEAEILRLNLELAHFTHQGCVDYIRPEGKRANSSPRPKAPDVLPFVA